MWAIFNAPTDCKFMTVLYLNVTPNTPVEGFDTTSAQPHPLPLAEHVNRSVCIDRNFSA